MESSNSPLVSIITLTYNNFSDIKSTLKSIFLQNYKEFEFILSDDGSINFPPKKIIHYIEENKPIGFKYRILKNKYNIGTVKHANKVYSEANGEIIIPLACGDEFYSEYTVSNIVEYFQKNNSKIVCCSRLLVDEKGRKIREMPSRTFYRKIKKLNTANKQNKAFILRETYEMASGSSTYMRKDFWESMGHFDEKYKLWEDGPFFEKITSRGVKIDIIIDFPTIKYQIGGISTGKNVNPILKIDGTIYNKYILEKIDKIGLSRFERRRLKYFIDKYESNIRVNIKYADVLLWKIKDFIFRKYGIYIGKIKIKNQ